MASIVLLLLLFWLTHDFPKIRPFAPEPVGSQDLRRGVAPPDSLVIPTRTPPLGFLKRHFRRPICPARQNFTGLIACVTSPTSFLPVHCSPFPSSPLQHSAPACIALRSSLRVAVGPVRVFTSSLVSRSPVALVCPAVRHSHLRSIGPRPVLSQRFVSFMSQNNKKNDVKYVYFMIYRNAQFVHLDLETLRDTWVHCLHFAS